MNNFRHFWPWLTSLALLVANPAAAEDSATVKRCEAALIAAIQTPSSYKRQSVETERQEDQSRFVMTIEFEASNIYGEPITARGACIFRQVPPSPRERENCPNCLIYVLDGVSLAGAFRPGMSSEPRIVSGGGF